jgi:hypothetical protein
MALRPVDLADDPDGIRRIWATRGLARHTDMLKSAQWVQRLR